MLIIFLFYLGFFLSSFFFYHHYYDLFIPFFYFSKKFQWAHFGALSVCASNGYLYFKVLHKKKYYIYKTKVEMNSLKKKFRVFHFSLSICIHINVRVCRLWSDYGFKSSSRFPNEPGGIIDEGSKHPSSLFIFFFLLLLQPTRQTGLIPAQKYQLFIAFLFSFLSLANFFYNIYIFYNIFFQTYG